MLRDKILKVVLIIATLSMVQYKANNLKDQNPPDSQGPLTDLAL